MKEETRKLLDKATHAIRAARLLLENGETTFASGRAYYAMFYVAEALLWEEGRRSSSHSGVHSLFGEQFAKTRRLEPKYHRWMLDAFDQRIQDDYGVDTVLAPDKAGETIEQASEFLRAKDLASSVSTRRPHTGIAKSRSLGSQILDLGGVTDGVPLPGRIWCSSGLRRCGLVWVDGHTHHAGVHGAAARGKAPDIGSHIAGRLLKPGLVR